jgi:cell division septal protein FtsQ
MEEEKITKKEAPKKKRRVSLFKRRKKSDIRPFVREKKKRQYKKYLSALILTVVALFLLVAILLMIKSVVIPRLFHPEAVILSPQGQVLPDNTTVRSIIQGKGLDVTDMQFATDSAMVTFTLHNSTQIYMPLDKNIEEQIRIIEAIDQQLMSEGKRAISIDLRYNKPIVKF